MHTGESNEPLQTFLDNEQFSTVREVDLSMARLQSRLRPAGRANLEEFHNTYHTVTTNIADKLDLELTHGVKVFREREVLNAATSEFYPLYTENIITPQKHWGWIDDERSLQVDGATRGVLGYASHIGGDLALTVHRVRQSGRFEERQIRNYLRYDYAPKIDMVLWQTAHQMAPILTNIENPAIRKAATNIFMLGVISGRQIALHESRKMARAKSDDHVESTVEQSRVRTAKLGDRILSLSTDLNQWVENESTKTHPEKPSIIDLGSGLKNNASRRVAQFIGSSLKKAA